MKCQFKLFRNAIACIAILSSAVFTSCGDDSGSAVAEGLSLRVNRTSIVAGERQVTFTVINNDEIVTNQAVIRNTTTNADVQGTTWTTDAKGTYTFTAIYAGSQSENTVDVTVYAPSDKFYHSVLLTKFTGTWCVPCAKAEPILVKYVSENPDRLTIYAAHANDGGFSSTDGDDLGNLFSIKTFPTWFFDMNNRIATITATGIQNQITTAIENAGTVCGVKATSSVSGNSATIKATVKFPEAGNYKICCLVAENGLYDNSNKRYAHVLRDFISHIEGDAMSAVTAGEEREFEYTAPLNSAWVLSNLEFVVYILKENADKEFIANNAMTCQVNGSVPYYHDPVL